MPNRKITPELDKLFEEVGTYRSSKEYFELLNFIVIQLEKYKKIMYNTKHELSRNI